MNRVERITADVKKLVAIPSVSGNEQAIGNHIAAEAREFGHDVYHLSNEVAVYIRGKNSKKAFILNGHTDTVDSNGWTSDRHEMYEEDGKLVGLGTTDMKSGLAIMLDIARKAQDKQPPCDVWLLFASMEEEDGEGAQELTKWFDDTQRQKYDTVGGLILEPTHRKDGDYVGYGHRSSLFVYASTKGPGGHGSRDYGVGDVPAVPRLTRFMADLPEIQKEWASRYSGDLGKPTLNGTNLVAGTGSVNVVPETATGTVDLRITPELYPDLPKALAELSETYGVKLEYNEPKKPSLCDFESTIYQVVKEVLPVRFEVFPGATDMTSFADKNIPMLIYGPGDPDVMHKPEESVALTAIENCASNVDQIIEAFAAR